MPLKPIEKEFASLTLVTHFSNKKYKKIFYVLHLESLVHGQHVVLHWSEKCSATKRENQPNQPKILRYISKYSVKKINKKKGQYKSLNF